MDNRAGGGGTIGLTTIAKAEPDGYTIGATSGSFATNAATYKLDYDPLALSLICLIGESGYLVTLPPSSPIKNIKDLIATARANPGKLNYGSSGHGGSTHLATELFESMTGVNMVEVPYKSTGAVLTALFAGEIHLVFGATMPSVLPQLKAGRVRVIATTTLKRSSLLPEVPTVRRGRRSRLRSLGLVRSSRAARHAGRYSRAPESRSGRYSQNTGSS